ncbi:hypothetical protein Ade02nite_46670 [Paractinoplanes deccanensis]|uniref:Uncharacterized protein n=1 Tax=Paractinoplanes deccanensis TaxID=113561 RepID=A0ABQ3Y7P9_9ACTN|nr:hypothetical protein Ade02nite_46670 [Actinoplanes deccanensis]
MPGAGLGHPQADRRLVLPEPPQAEVLGVEGRTRLQIGQVTITQSILRSIDTSSSRGPNSIRTLGAFERQMPHLRDRHMVGWPHGTS